VILLFDLELREYCGLFFIDPFQRVKFIEGLWMFDGFFEGNAVVGQGQHAFLLVYCFIDQNQSKAMENSIII
jgi:hypothetical protein